MPQVLQATRFTVPPAEEMPKESPAKKAKKSPTAKQN